MGREGCYFLWAWHLTLIINNRKDMERTLRKNERECRRISLVIGMVLLGFVSAFAQMDTSAQAYPYKANNIHQVPQLPTSNQISPQTGAPAYPATPESIPMDTVKKNHLLAKFRLSDPTPASTYKLTEAQIKILVGKDTPVGRDAHGHQLYKDSGRMIYYVGDGGTKVYVR